jgi:hypothetical protein
VKREVHVALPYRPPYILQRTHCICFLQPNAEQLKGSGAAAPANPDVRVIARKCRVAEAACSSVQGLRQGAALSPHSCAGAAWSGSQRGCGCTQYVARAQWRAPLSDLKWGAPRAPGGRGPTTRCLGLGLTGS